LTDLKGIITPSTSFLMGGSMFIWVALKQLNGLAPAPEKNGSIFNCFAASCQFDMSGRSTAIPGILARREVERAIDIVAGRAALALRFTLTFAFAFAFAFLALTIVRLPCHYPLRLQRGCVKSKVNSILTTPFEQE
jgi:hypothetical protein